MDDPQASPGEGSRRRKPKRSPSPDEGLETTTRPLKFAKKEVVDNEEPCMIGSGSKQDPISLLPWTNENVIIDNGDGQVICISDDEEGETAVISDKEVEGNDKKNLFVEKASRILSSPRESSADSDGGTFWDASELPSSGSAPTPTSSTMQSSNHVPSGEDTEDDDFILVTDGDDSDFERLVRRIPLWPTLQTIEVKQEKRDDVPELDLSQSTVASDYLVTPTSSQNTSHGTIAIELASPLPLKHDEGQVKRNCVEKIGPFEYESANDADLKARKRLALYQYMKLQQERLQNRLKKYHENLKLGMTADDCWLFVHPTTANINGSLHMTIRFVHEGERLKLNLNTSFVSMWLHGRLTDEMKEGIIEKGLTASHLCGNWTCLNDKHICAEDLGTNQSRNHCFPAIDGPCKHNPPCMRHLKQDHIYLKYLFQESRFQAKTPRMD